MECGFIIIPGVLIFMDLVGKSEPWIQVLRKVYIFIVCMQTLIFKTTHSNINENTLYTWSKKIGMKENKWIESTCLYHIHQSKTQRGRGNKLRLNLALFYFRTYTNGHTLALVSLVCFLILVHLYVYLGASWGQSPGAGFSHSLEDPLVAFSCYLLFGLVVVFFNIFPISILNITTWFIHTNRFPKLSGWYWYKNLLYPFVLVHSQFRALHLSQVLVPHSNIPHQWDSPTGEELGWFLQVWPVHLRPTFTHLFSPQFWHHLHI